MRSFDVLNVQEIELDSDVKIELQVKKTSFENNAFVQQVNAIVCNHSLIMSIYFDSSFNCYAETFLNVNYVYKREFYPCGMHAEMLQFNTSGKINDVKTKCALYDKHGKLISQDENF